jgi:hypothetical protein
MLPGERWVNVFAALMLPYSAYSFGQRVGRRFNPDAETVSRFAGDACDAGALLAALFLLAGVWVNQHPAVAFLPIHPSTATVVGFIVFVFAFWGAVPQAYAFARYRMRQHFRVEAIR